MVEVALRLSVALMFSWHAAAVCRALVRVARQRQQALWASCDLAGEEADVELAAAMGGFLCAVALHDIAASLRRLVSGRASNWVVSLIQHPPVWAARLLSSLPTPQSFVPHGTEISHTMTPDDAKALSP